MFLVIFYLPKFFRFNILSPFKVFYIGVLKENERPANNEFKIEIVKHTGPFVLRI